MSNGGTGWIPLTSIRETVLRDHIYLGRGLGCSCGSKPNNVESWGRHVLTIALTDAEEKRKPRVSGETRG